MTGITVAPAAIAPALWTWDPPNSVLLYQDSLTDPRPAIAQALTAIAAHALPPCESCEARPGTSIVMADREPFLICDGCAPIVSTPPQDAPPSRVGVETPTTTVSAGRPR